MAPRRNRIIDHRVVKGRDLLPNPANWRTHPPQQRAATTAALDLLGYVDELKVVAAPEGMLLLDGHLRAQIGEDDDIPVAVVDLDPDEQRIFLATYDPLAAMAITDLPAFDALTDVIATEDETLMRLLEGVRQHDSPLLLAQRSERDAEVTGGALEKVEAEDYEPFTKRGQVWQLGEHRLMCGDAPVDIAVLTNGLNPDLLLTDPPYGVNYDPTAMFVHGAGHPLPRANEGMLNDDGSLDLGWLSQFDRRLVWGFPHVGNGERGWLVWDKHPGLEGESIGNPVEMAASTLWAGFKIVRVLWGGYYRAAGETRGEHPTQKPLGVIAPYIEQFCESTVLDPFVGSGTTIIAAENLGRRCYAMEIEPRYCDVAIQRWEAYTGAKAELLE